MGHSEVIQDQNYIAQLNQVTQSLLPKEVLVVVQVCSTFSWVHH